MKPERNHFLKYLEGLTSSPFFKDSSTGSINELIKSDPGLPFVSIKNSGYGRELAKFGMKEFVNRRTVYVKN